MDSLFEHDLFPMMATIIMIIGGVGAILLFGLTKERHPVALSSSVEFAKYPLIDKKIISHDTRRFTFALPSPKHKLGLPIGQHMTLMFVDPATNKTVQRSYTPVTGDETLGQVSFVIKVYHKNVHPKFPNGGQLSQYLDALAIGDTLDMKGPKGHLTWLCQSDGSFTIRQVRAPKLVTRQATHIGMIAGGTGITPMLQILTAIFTNPNDTTIVKLLYANQSEDDILVRPELEALAAQHPTRFSLHYTVDRPPATTTTTAWKYSTGFITKEMIETHLFVKKKDGEDDASTTKIQYFLCGPPPMIKFACLPNLEAMGDRKSVV